MFKNILVTTVMTSAILVAESGVGLNINENDLEIEAVLDSRNLEALQTSSTVYQGDFNFLEAYSKKLLGAGIGATNKLEGIEGVELTFGVKFISAEVGDEYFTSLPLMVKVRYDFPPLMFNIPPVSVEAKGLYAPNPLSFGNSEEYSEFRLAADIEMINNVKVYAGYRNIHTYYKGISQNLFDTGFYGGLKVIY